MIRQPEFVTEEDLGRAAQMVHRKKPLLDISKARLSAFAEGFCVQCTHIGSYDDEPATIRKMKEYMAQNGLICDLSDTRRHHEIYLGDPRKTEDAKKKTILRYPVRRA